LGAEEHDLPGLYASSKVTDFANSSWNRKIFKFNLGQKVLVARRSNWKK